MPANYNIIVSSQDESFVAYTASDEDEAQGYADFCRASLVGAKVRVERIEW